MSEDLKTFTTNKVRVVYPNLLRAGGAQNKFGVQLLIPKSDTETVDRMKKAKQAAIDDKWPSKKPSNIELPYKDGDSESFENHSLKEHYAGHYVLQCGSGANYKNATIRHIHVVDQNLNVLTEDSETRVSGGDYCKVVINMYGNDNMSNRVVALAKCVQLIGKGEPLGFSEAPIETIVTQFLKQETVEHDSLGLIADTMSEAEKEMLKGII